MVGGGGGVTADSMLQKVTAGLAAGSYPDIAYIFGSDLASMTRSPQVADLTAAAALDDYWPAARDAVTVKGKVRAAPALLDSLCVVYNKKLFAAAGLPGTEGGLDLGRLHRHRAEADQSRPRASSAPAGRASATRTRSGGSGR